MALDFSNRDPNGIIGHVVCDFPEVFAEPDSTHSIDCVWSNSYRCFNCSKNFCYKLMTLLCGICIAFAWGCDFACTAFDHVWCVNPFMRSLSITIGAWQKCFGMFINCCCVPCCEGIGHVFAKIAIKKL